MSFWLSALALIATSAVFILWPLLRRSEHRLERGELAMAIFRDQLAEVDRDMARGLISDGEAEAARAEIKRRMLAADKDGSGRVAVGSGNWAVVALAALIPLGGAGLYALVGQPGMPSVPFAQREALEQQEASEINALITTLRERLEAEPDGGDARGWELLATTLMNQNRYAEAAEAWAQIVDRPGTGSASWSQYAETLIASENGVVTEEAERAIARALEADPSNPAATFFRAIALDQAGQTIDARVLLLRRIEQEQREAPWMQFYLREINRMGEGFGLDPVGLPDFPQSGPSAEDIEAASQMSPEERQEFIRSMVDGLAARLEEEPADLQGWLQLARSYMMLGERDAALEALQSARLLTADLPADDPRRLTVEKGLTELSQ